MKKITKSLMFGLGFGLIALPLSVAASCGESSTEVVTDKTVNLNLDMLKQVKLMGDSQNFQVALAPELTKFNDQGLNDISGKEIVKIEARVKTIVGAESDKINTSFMPVDVLKAYLRNDRSITFSDGEPKLRVGATTTSLKTLYGSTYGFTNSNTELPDYTGVIIALDSFEMRYVALPGYKLSTPSAVTIAPQLDETFKEMVNISLSEKYFTPAVRAQLIDTIDFAKNTATVFSTNEALIYKTATLSFDMLPEVWKPLVSGMEFETSSKSTDELVTNPQTAVWSSARPTSLPFDEASRHILFRLKPLKTTQVLSFAPLDIYGFLPNKVEIKKDLKNVSANFIIDNLSLSWNDTTKKVLANLGTSSVWDDKYFDLKVSFSTTLSNASSLLTVSSVVVKRTEGFVEISDERLTNMTAAERQAAATTGGLILTLTPKDLVNYYDTAPTEKRVKTVNFNQINSFVPAALTTK